MALRPPNFTWLGFTPDEVRQLEFLDHLGNNGCDRNGQTDEIMPKVMQGFADSGVTLGRVKAAMAAVGYDRADLHQLDRWESKRTTGRFGR